MLTWNRPAPWCVALALECGTARDVCGAGRGFELMCRGAGTCHQEAPALCPGGVPVPAAAPLSRGGNSLCSGLLGKFLSKRAAAKFSILYF